MKLNPTHGKNNKSIAIRQADDSKQTSNSSQRKLAKFVGQMKSRLFEYQNRQQQLEQLEKEDTKIVSNKA